MGDKRHLSINYSAYANCVVELPTGVNWDDIEWNITYDTFYWWRKGAQDPLAANSITLDRSIEIGDTKIPLSVEVYLVDSNGWITWEPDIKAET